MEDYYIITKIENINGNIIYTNIGYVISELDTETINQNYFYNNYTNWVETNKVDLDNEIKFISDYFINTPIVFGCFTQTSNIDEYNIPLITNINNL